MASVEPRVAVVVATRDRRDSLRRTLDHLTALPEQPPVVVVDNASRDGTASLVRDGYPQVRLVRLETNLGGGARTVGARTLSVPYVAFADDDSWWAPGALAAAARTFDARPRLAVLNGKILVGAEGRLDPTCAAMDASPLPRRPDLPGPALLGFVACGTVVRRTAFLSVGGFRSAFEVGGEEELVSLDLAAAGWELAYVADVVAHHHPSPARSATDRRRRELRNSLWVALLRLPLAEVAARTGACLAQWPDQAARTALREAASGLPWAVAHRRRLPAAVERARRLL